MAGLNRRARIKHRYDHYSDTEEGDYHKPEEPVIHYPPPKDYTDRLPRTWPSRSGLGDTRIVLDIPPRPPKRTIGNAAPVINRDLKPGRQPKITSEQRLQTLGSNETKNRTPPRLVKSLPKDPCSHLCPPPASLPTFNHAGDSPPHRPPPSTPQRPAHNNTHTQTEPVISLLRDQSSHLCPPAAGAVLPTVDQAGNWPPHRPSPSTPQCSAHSDIHTETDNESPRGCKNVNNRPPGFKNDSFHRLSLDLESQDMERSYSDQINSKDSVRQQHHEWPKVKGDTNHSSYTGHSKPMEASAEQDWYVGQFSRVEAEHALHLVNQEGAFLVRDCSKKTNDEPFVLAVFYENRVFNIQIRFCKETCKYMLGTRIKTNDTFDSVADIIKFHSIFPIVLIDGRNPSANHPKKHCILMYPITVQDMSQLLSSTSTAQ